MSPKPQKILPVDVVFYPDWWHTHCGLDFREPFHFDPQVRVESDLRRPSPIAARGHQVTLCLCCS